MGFEQPKTAVEQTERSNALQQAGWLYRRLMVFLGLAGVIWLCFGQSIQASYVWDDRIFFIDSAGLRADNITWKAISRPVLDGLAYFRPLVLLSFAMEHQPSEGGASAPALSHAINLALHFINCMLLFELVAVYFRKLGYNRMLPRSAVAAGLYAIHPSLVESAAWISGRFDLMVTTFVLAGLLADQIIREQWLRITVVASTFLLALGCKELAICLPPLLLLQRLMIETNDGSPFLRRVFSILREHRWQVLALGVVFALYLNLRLSALGSLLQPAGTDQAQNFGISRWMLAANAIRFYVFEAVYPFASLSPYHPIQSYLTNTGDWVAGAVCGFCLLALLVLLCMRNQRGRAWFLLCAFICICPVLHLISLPTAGNIGHDRFLTLPLVFVAMFFASLTPVGSDLLRPAYQSMVAGIVAVSWAVAAISFDRVTTLLWGDELRLWTWIYERNPTFVNAQMNYIAATRNRNRLDLTKSAFDRILVAGRMDYMLQVAYTSYLVDIGEPDEAEKYVEGALAAVPPFHTWTPAMLAAHPEIENMRAPVATLYSVLVTVAMSRHDYPLALERADTVLWYEPDYPMAWMLKAEALTALGRYDEAKPLFDRSVKASVGYQQRQGFLARQARAIRQYCASNSHLSANVDCEVKNMDRPLAASMPVSAER